MFLVIESLRDLDVYDLIIGVSVSAFLVVVVLACGFLTGAI